MSNFKWVSVDPKKKRVITKKEWEPMLSHIDFSGVVQQNVVYCQQHKEHTENERVLETTSNQEKKVKKTTEVTDASSSKLKMSIDNLLNPKIDDS